MIRKDLLLFRNFDSGSETIGMLYFKSDKLRFVHTLEDPYNEHKIPGSTRISAGQYEIKLIKEGRHYEEYCNHKNDEIAELTRKYGVMQLQNVPNFAGILIHIGNFNHNTSGCILVGNNVNNPSYEDGLITNSTSAYLYLIKNIFPFFNTGKLFITIKDNDREIQKLFKA